jgi:hypothetical protein
LNDERLPAETKSLARGALVLFPLTASTQAAAAAAAHAQNLALQYADPAFGSALIQFWTQQAAVAAASAAAPYAVEPSP